MSLSTGCESSSVLIENAIDRLLSNVSHSFSFCDAESLQPLTLSIQQPIQYAFGFITLQWHLSSATALVRQITQTLLPFANVDRENTKTSYVILRNESNGDIAQDVLYLLTHDENGDIISTISAVQNAATSHEREELNRIELVSQKEAELLTQAVQKIQEDRNAYMENLMKQADVEKNSNDTVPSTTVLNLHSSNFVNWYFEGQQVYRSDEIHKQLWNFVKVWNESFRLLAMNSNGNIQSIPWMTWDVQNLYFGEAYESLYNAENESEFATSIFCGIFNDENNNNNSNDVFVVYNKVNDTYITLKNPSEFQFSIHFQRKKHTGEGFFIHRFSMESKESGESMSRLLGGRNQSVLNQVYKKYADDLWDIRVKQHLPLEAEQDVIEY